MVSQLLQKSLGTDNADIFTLDVGGRVELLSRFLPYKVISVNPDTTGQVMGSGLALPFVNNAFSAVVNIDTLEHLPAESRLPFLQECVRVARRFVVVAAPFASQGHGDLEVELNQLYQQVHGNPHQYLSEHVRYGLPDMAQLDAFDRALRPAEVTQYFAGDYVWQGKVFRRSVNAEGKSKLLRRFLNLTNWISSMALFHPIQLQKQPAPTSNRFYLLIEIKP